MEQVKKCCNLCSKFKESCIIDLTDRGANKLYCDDFQPKKQTRKVKLYAHLIKRFLSSGSILDGRLNETLEWKTIEMHNQENVSRIPSEDKEVEVEI